MEILSDIYLDRYLVSKGDVVDLETGEQLSRKLAQLIINQKTKDDHAKNIKNMVESGGEPDTRLVKNKHGQSFHVINVKEGYDFVKTFKVEARELLREIDLSLNACGFMYKAINYIHFPSNTVVIDYETPDIEKMCKVFKIKRTNLYKILKELEQKGVIIRKKVNGQSVIYINPLLHSCGLVDVDVYHMFIDSFNK